VRIGSTSNRQGTVPGFISDSPLARSPIRIGDEAIAREDDAKLRDYYAKDYLFHGPGGDMGFDGLSAYFAWLLAAFSNPRLVREQIIADGLFLTAQHVLWQLHQRLHILARRTSRAHRPARRMGSDPHVQVRRPRATGQGVGATRLPQILDQARRDRHGVRSARDEHQLVRGFIHHTSQVSAPRLAEAIGGYIAEVGSRDSSGDHDVPAP
jgi:hypothetical protein